MSMAFFAGTALLPWFCSCLLDLQAILAESAVGVNACVAAWLSN
ncbi:hypothetical protein [Testudinibacter sp. TR-2022]|nr:hypothetical protein [Testudinibacter sp. TR-2022]